MLRTRERYRMPTMRNALIGAAALIVGMYLVRELLAPTAINTWRSG